MGIKVSLLSSVISFLLIGSLPKTETRSKAYNVIKKQIKSIKLMMGSILRVFLFTSAVSCLWARTIQN